MILLFEAFRLNIFGTSAGISSSLFKVHKGVLIWLIPTLALRFSCFGLFGPFTAHSFLLSGEQTCFLSTQVSTVEESGDRGHTPGHTLCVSQ